MARCMVAALDERALTMQRIPRADPRLRQASRASSGPAPPRFYIKGQRHFHIHLGPATGVVAAFTHPQAAGVIRTLRRQPLLAPGRHSVEGPARGGLWILQHLSMELNVKIDGKPSSFLLACLTMLLMLGVVFWQVIVRTVFWRAPHAIVALQQGLACLNLHSLVSHSNVGSQMQRPGVSNCGGTHHRDHLPSHP